ncbi:MAG TPA: class I SAM-dependent methyltransferase [Candidatus Acidoferrales bacterium]|nr:class I SAM-dependent methyltransferase [Candidatus Acidoferrales bacterium]
MLNSKKAWKKWGDENPYYAVVSTEGLRKENISDEALAAFFESGRLHIDHVFSTIESKLDPLFAPKKVVDFGCGTGRLTIPLSKRCEKVIGIDVAPSMLREATENCIRFNVSNAQFAELDSGLKMLRDIDLLHSFIVFQHIPVRQGLKTIDRLLSSLSPDGCVVLHVTFERNASVLKKIGFWARNNIPLAHSILQLALRRSVSDPPMQMNHYPLNALLKKFYRSGFQSVYLEITDHNGFLGVIIYAKNQKPVVRS